MKPAKALDSERRFSSRGVTVLAGLVVDDDEPGSLAEDKINLAKARGGFDRLNGTVGVKNESSEESTRDGKDNTNNVH